MLLYREQCERKMTTATGAALLFIFLRRYEIERGQALQVDLQILMAHKYQGNLEDI